MSCICAVAIAERRSAVARGNENGNAFCDRLLISGVVCSVSRGAVFRFAFAVADANHCRWWIVAVDQILQRDQATESANGVRTGSQNNCGAGCGRTGPFRIKDSFTLVGG